MNPMAMNRRNQSGLTLVEIMVAIGISAILLTGVLQILVSSKQSYRILEATARIQENGRFAIDFMTADLRMAGYTGCFRDDLSAINSILNNPTDFAWDMSIPIQGHEWDGAGWSPALPAILAGEVVPGTDVVVTRGLSSDGINLVPPFTGSGGGGAAQLFVSPEGNTIQIGDIIMVTDCSRAAIGQTTNVQVVGGGSRVNLVHSAGGGPPGNTSPPQLGFFGPGSEVARLQTNIYYIGNGANNNEPALFRRSLTNGGLLQAQELVDGVENLQVLYGEDLDGDGLANRYVAADAVGAMANVVSIRASLLLRTDNNIASTPQTYVYDGETVDAADQRMRRVFTSTIKIRNRGVL